MTTVTKTHFFKKYKSHLPYTGDKSIILHFEDSKGNEYKLNAVGRYGNKESGTELSLLEILQQGLEYKPTVILQDGIVQYIF
jgi:hypothetical protein